jgi:hypothetical protein
VDTLGEDIKSASGEKVKAVLRAAKAEQALETLKQELETLKKELERLKIFQEEEVGGGNRSFALGWRIVEDQ